MWLRRAMCESNVPRSLLKSCGVGNAFDLTFNLCIPEELLDKDKCQFKHIQSKGDENIHNANFNTTDSEVLFELSQGPEDFDNSKVIETGKLSKSMRNGGSESDRMTISHWVGT